MKTTMDCRTLGESKTNYTNSNVRQIRQTDLPTATAHSSSTPYSESYSGSSERDALGHRVPASSTYQTRTSKERKGISGGKIAAGVLAGASVGVLAGILLAPEKGKDLRKQVANSASRIGDKVTKSFSDTKNKVTSWTSKSNNSSGNLQSSPYTDPGKHSSAEVNRMVNDPALGPSGTSNMQRCL